MSILDLTIKEIHEALVNKEIKVSDLVKESLERAKNNKDNAFEIILEEEALKKAYELDKVEVEKVLENQEPKVVEESLEKVEN